MLDLKAKKKKEKKKRKKKERISKRSFILEGLTAVAHVSH